MHKPNAEQMMKIMSLLDSSSSMPGVMRRKRGITKPPHNKAKKKRLRKIQRIARRANK